MTAKVTLLDLTAGQVEEIERWREYVRIAKIEPQ